MADFNSAYTGQEIDDAVEEVQADHGILSGTGYTKFPDGTLICYGSGSTNILYDFPIPFTITPSMAAIHRGSTGVNMIISTLSLTDFTTKSGYDNGNTSIDVLWQAIGRWK